jgi:sigma-B regulation protein RsbU (phosphoserine phosphatase)
MQSVNPPGRNVAVDTEEAYVDDLGRAFAILSEAALLIDSSGIVRAASPTAEHLLGFRPAELVGTFLGLLISTIAETAPDAKFPAGRWRAVAKRKNGTVIHLQGSCSELATRPDWFVIVLHEAASEAKIDSAEALLANALREIPWPVLLITAEGCLVYANPAFLALTASENTPPAPNGQSDDGQAIDTLKAMLAETQHDWSALIASRTEGSRESILPLRDPDGQITHYLIIDGPATTDDSTRRELETSEQRFRKVAEMAGEWLWEQDQQGRYTYSSAAVFDILGYQPEEMEGKSYLDVLTPEDRKHWTEQLPLVPNIPRRFHRLTNRYAHRDGHEVFTESSGEPLLGDNGEILKWWGVDHDITARKRIEDALRLRDRAIEAADVGIAILDARQPGHPLIYANPAFCAMTGYSDIDLLNRPHPFAQCSISESDCRASLQTAIDQQTSCSVTLQLPRKDGTSFWCDLVMSVVQDDDQQVSHFILVIADVSEEQRAAEARRELDTARRIQASLLPKSTLRTDGLEAAGICLPAGAIGGDYFDYFTTPEGISVTVADVSGHNIGAALIMTETRSALRAKTITPHVEGHHGGPSQLLDDLNELLFDDLNGADLFITMFYLVFDRMTRRLTYANAGHNPALLARQESDQCAPLDAEGLVLGVKRGIVFEERSVLLKPGDTVLLYTDGVTEARNASGEMFGTDRLSALLIEHRERAPEELIDCLIGTVRDFVGATGLSDDTSMVVLKVC